MISTGIHKLQNSRVYYQVPPFLLTLPILLQLLLTSNQLFDSNFSRWVELKVITLALYVCWYMATLGTIYLLKIKFKYLALPIFISLIVAFYIIITGENIEYEVYASINNTNSSEFLELFLSSTLLVPLVLVLLIFSITYKYFLTDNIYRNKKLFLSKRHLSILLFISGLGLSLIYGYQKDTLHKTYPINIPYFQKMYLTELYFFKKRFNKVKYELPPNLNLRKKNALYILVIGETARKHSMSAYGYLKDTTPYMKKNVNSIKRNAFVFDATASGISTRLSVPMLLSTANTNKYKFLSTTPTLIHMFNALDFNTTLISNQEVSGRNNDIISLMFRDMKNRHYINDETVSNEAVNWNYDIKLIPRIEKIISGDSKNDFIIVHLMGSHWDYKRRYPENFSIYKDDRIGNYDDSIRYTDYVVGKIVDLINSSKRPAALIYTSDHGENLNDSGDGNILHAVKEMTKYEIQIPLFLTFNKYFVKFNGNKINNVSSNNKLKISHDNISHTFLGLAGIYDSSVYDEKYDISSVNFKETTRYAINRRREVVDVDKLLNNKVSIKNIIKY